MSCAVKLRPSPRWARLKKDEISRRLVFLSPAQRIRSPDLDPIYNCPKLLRFLINLNFQENNFGLYSADWWGTEWRKMMIFLHELYILRRGMWHVSTVHTMPSDMKCIDLRITHWSKNVSNIISVILGQSTYECICIKPFFLDIFQNEMDRNTQKIVLYLSGRLEIKSGGW